jgi:hypothetical protein
LSNLVPFNIFLGKNYFLDFFHIFFLVFSFIILWGFYSSQSFSVFFSIILISDWLKLLQESKEENAIFFVFLEMCKQIYEVTEFEFPALKLLLSPKNYVPPIHYLFTFLAHYVPLSHCLFTKPNHYLPPFHCLFTLPKLFFFHSTVCLHSQKLISLVIVLIL